MADRKTLMILIAGPYRSGTGDDPEKMAANLRLMERYALPLFRAGHMPVVKEWFALPIVALAGSRRVGDEAFDEVFHPSRADSRKVQCGPAGWRTLCGRRPDGHYRPQAWARGLFQPGEVPGCAEGSQ